jgi:hypothetical protein
MAADLTWANICDKNGNLLYITNGIYIADKNCDSIVNGTGINPLCDYGAKELNTKNHTTEDNFRQ